MVGGRERECVRDREMGTVDELRIHIFFSPLLLLR